MADQAEIADLIARLPGESCGNCRHGKGLSPGHAIICFARWDGLPWNAAVPLTSADEWCNRHAPSPQEPTGG